MSEASGPPRRPTRARPGALLLLRRALLHHRLSFLGSALSAAVAAAVLTGALLVGDSVRGSLRGLSLERLGKVELALVAPRTFPADLAKRLGARPEVRSRFEPPAAALLLPASAMAPGPDGSGPRRGGVTAMGLGSDALALLGNTEDAAGALAFLGDARETAPAPAPRPRSAAVGGSLGGELALAPGKPLVLSLETLEAAPRESFAGRREDAARSLRLEVREVLPARGAGSFSLDLHQRPPRNVLLDIDVLGKALGLPGRANAILATARASATARAPLAGAEAKALLERELRQAATLEDLGLRLHRDPRGFLQVESTEFQIDPLLEEPLAAAVEALGAPLRRLSTYLANTIALTGRGSRRETPYSTVTALEHAAGSPLGALWSLSGEPAPAPGPGEILLSAWAAEDLEAREGDTVELDYFVVGAAGDLSTAWAGFRVRGVVQLAGMADDPRLTPAFPGVTDAETLGDWDPPFPVDLKRIRRKDEDYWKAHRATPKAFLALEEGRRLWGNRFGSLTAFRVSPAPGKSLEETEELLRAEVARRLEPERLGLSFRTVREDALAAARGSTDYGVLFLAFSAFIIVSSAVLGGLFWALAVERRAREWGILRAAGLSGRAVGRLALGEALLVCGAGGLLGLLLAPFAARALLAGLLGRLEGALGPSPLSLHLEARSFAWGYGASLAVTLLATALATRRIARASPVSLLSGGWGLSGGRALSGRARTARPRRAPLLAGALFAAAAALLLAPALAPGALAAARPALFFTAGAALLASSVALVRMLLTGSRRSPEARRRARGVLWLGALNARRHPARSTATAALVAAAAFVIVAAGAFRPGGGAEEEGPRSGSGGFSLVADLDVPVVGRLTEPRTRADLGLPDELAGKPVPWDRVDAVGLRVAEGDDASCLNLYRAARPTLLGAPHELVWRGGFRFHSSEARPGTPEHANPWLLLEDDLRGGAVPAIADEATATWVLHAGLGDELILPGTARGEARLRLVGLLRGSIFQGALLTAESRFLEIHPQVTGYRKFLLAGTEEDLEPVRRALEDALAARGVEVETARAILARFQAVEAAYLDTFRVLGGLGLLLGSAGLGAVLLRGALERRGELALLRALGFLPGALSALVLAENALLVAAGLAAGSLSALVAASPHLASGARGVPWASLAVTLAAAAAIGLAAGALGVLAALRSPLLPALKEER